MLSLTIGITGSVKFRNLQLTTGRVTGLGINGKVDRRQKYERALSQRWNVRKSSGVMRHRHLHPPSSTQESRLHIPREIREKTFELLWERDNDNLSIPTMILDAIVKCPIDTRRPLAENIILIGGTAMTEGFANRLKSELSSLLKSDLYSEKLKLDKFKFHTAPSKSNCRAWLGGVIFGIADLPSGCLTKETYLQINRVPDWASLLDSNNE